MGAETQKLEGQLPWQMTRDVRDTVGDGFKKICSLGQREERGCKIQICCVGHIGSENLKCQRRSSLGQQLNGDSSVRLPDKAHMILWRTMSGTQRGNQDSHSRGEICHPYGPRVW